MSITITTLPATNIIRNSATLNSSISGIASGEEYNVRFKYKPIYLNFPELFETWLSGDILPDWYIPSGTEYYKEETIVQQGNYSLKIIPDGFTQVEAILLAEVTPYKGKTLEYSLWMRSNVDSACRFNIYSPGSGVIVGDDLGATVDTWVNVKGEITIPSNASGQLELNLHSDTNPLSGEILYYDNIDIRIYGDEIETPIQLILTDTSFNADITDLINSQIYSCS